MSPPLPQRRASERIAETLRREIVAGRYGNGVLDPTPALMSRFGVSRPTLREAFRVLESERLIEVKHGSRAGVRVLSPSSEGAMRLTGQALQASRATIEQLYEARLAFEPFAARLVAERSDRRDIARLREALAAMQALVADRRWADLGAALARFHHLLVACTGNQVLTLTAETIASLLERHQWNRNRQHELADDPGTLEYRSRGVRSSARLIALVEAGNAAEAEAHWRTHLENANAYWLERQDRHAVIDILDSGD